MTDPAGTLDAARWCTLLLRTTRGPGAVPMACWSDGSGLWLAAPADSAEVGVLRRDPDCQVVVGLEASATVVLRGAARIYGAHDPLGLLLHSPVVSAAMAALAVNHAGDVLDYVAEAARVPARRLPRDPVAIRLAVGEPAPAEDLAVEGGLAPPLPSVVPADVRRALTGVRCVVLVRECAGGRGHGGLDTGPAVWGAGFSLSLPPRRRLEAGTRVLATVIAEANGKPAGLALHGSLEAGCVLRAERVTWWRGASAETIDLPPATSSLTLPN
ncbi:MAG: hypothetical protein M3387_06740 [Actinomycetota bacterium]|nr:hypothetical protein [Actinomycetota bacterium]